MKSAFRSFHSPKQLLPLFKLSPSLSRQFPQFSRQFHSTNSCLCSARESEPDTTNRITQNSPRLWTIYNHAIANQVSEPSGERDLGRETTDGNVNIDISGDLEKPNEAVYNHAIANQVSESSDEGDLERETTDGNVKTESWSDLEKSRWKKRTNLGFGEIVRIKKKGKASRVSWVCADCGYTDGQWWGMCRSCESVGTMKRFTEGESGEGHVVERTWLPQKPEEVRPVRLPEVNKGINQLDWRIPLSGLFGNEVARVLGGGLVPGSLVLVGGDPGVGKSTLLLQMAAIIAEGCDHGKSYPVVYVSGEESVEQIGNRADRMRIGTEELFLYSSTDVEDIIEKVQPLSPRVLIIDSIQTVYLKGVTGSAGGLMQVKECTSALLRFAKKTNIPVLLVGHVTKSGDIAGPRVLEHIVDAVLYMEGEKYSSYRLLRPVKNRFGSTDELGVFEMSQFGLQAVSNPSKMFLSEQHSDSEFLAGLAVAVIVDGSWTFLIEIQALCVSGSTVSRHVNGIQASRADMIIAVLMKQAGVKLQENALFLNVVSGLALTETAGDLAVAAAICSSFLEFPIPNGIAFIGEIGLGGELRMVSRMEKRVSTLAKLGYEKCIVPQSAEKSLATLGFNQMEIIGCKNLKEVINIVFTTPQNSEIILSPVYSI